MKTIEVPEYVLNNIDNTLRECFIILGCEDSCVVRDIQTARICLAKIFNGEPLTGHERTEAMGFTKKTS